MIFIGREETNTANILAFLQETEELLQQISIRNKQLKDMEMKVGLHSLLTEIPFERFWKIPHLVQPDPISFNVSQLIGELKFDDFPSSQTVANYSNGRMNGDDSSILTANTPERTRFPRRMRPSIRSRGNRGLQPSSHIIGMSPRNNTNYRKGR